MEYEDDLSSQRIGQLVGNRWTLERLLGIGGMAAVYAARDPQGHVAAIKLLHLEMSVRHDVRERFLREGCVPNQIGHPGTVRILEHGSSEDESAYLAMELLDGESVGDRVRRLGSLPLPELLDLMDQVLDVLAAAHAKGIIHRDLKPENLFITRDGRTKVLDFGLARLLEDVPGGFKTRTGVALGTLPYMAPEQALGRREYIDGRVDLFALGATAFRILTGRRVHEGDSEAELLIAMASRPAPPLASVAPHVPPDLCTVIDVALAFSRDARYPDARTMQADVRALRHGQRPSYALQIGAQHAARTADAPSPAPGSSAAPPSSAGPSSRVAPPSSAAPLMSPAAPPSSAGASPVTAPTTSARSPSPGRTASTSRGPSRGVWIAGGLALVLLSFTATFAWLRSTRPSAAALETESAAAGELPSTAPSAPARPSAALSSAGAPPGAAPGSAARPSPRRESRTSAPTPRVAAPRAPAPRTTAAAALPQVKVREGADGTKSAKVSGPGFEISTSFSLPKVDTGNKAKARDSKR